ncbi:hypothetical protein HKM21_10695 [Longimicrobium terrae]|nr:hypothetical protein [Longimicrobium terrae]
MMPKYKLKLMFEWGGGCLWCDDDATRDAFDVGHIDERLPLSPGMLARLDELSRWHDGALDGDDPAGPSPWSAEEDDRFRAAAEEALAAVRAELGPNFHVEYRR